MISVTDISEYHPLLWCWLKPNSHLKLLRLKLFYSSRNEIWLLIVCKSWRIVQLKQLGSYEKVWRNIQHQERYKTNWRMKGYVGERRFSGSPPRARFPARFFRERKLRIRRWIDPGTNHPRDLSPVPFQRTTSSVIILSDLSEALLKSVL